MRTPIEILEDVCKGFGITLDIYKSFQNGKRPPEYINLITMSYVYILLSTTTMNLSDIAKTLDKKPNTISVCKNKIFQIINLDTTYSKALRRKIRECCEEGRQSLETQK